MRACFLAMCGTGLVAKVLVSYAPEVQYQMKKLKQGDRNRGAIHVGAVLLLMRQAFARKGVDAVVTCVQGENCGLTNLKSLLKAWQDIRKKDGAKHCKKTQSRSAAFTGDTWLRQVVEYIEKGCGKGGKAFSETDWVSACELLGEICLSPNGPTKAYPLRTAILAKLPCIDAKYGANHIMRCAHVARVHVFKLPPLTIDAKEWEGAAGMTKANTAAGFANLGIHSLEEAHAAKHVVTSFMGTKVFASKTTRSKFMKMLTIELPCAVCEWQGALKHVRRAQKLPTLEAAAKIVMAKLPCDPHEMGELRVSLMGTVWKGEDVVTGQDTMRATAVTNVFLKNALDIDGDSVLAAFENDSLDFGLSKFRCDRCSDLFMSAETSHKGGPYVTACTKCNSCMNKRKRPEYEEMQADIGNG